jgi:hypothetical protein
VAYLKAIIRVAAAALVAAGLTMGTVRASGPQAAEAASLASALPAAATTPQPEPAPEAAPQPTPEARVLLDAGRQLETRRHWKAAEAHYLKMEQQRLAPIQAHLGRARVRAHLGDHEGAARLYQDVMQADPGNVEARIGSAREAHSLGLDRKAIPQVDTLVQDHPENKEARALQREIHLDQRPSVEAEPALQDDNGGNRVKEVTAAGEWKAEPQTSVRLALTGQRTSSDTAPGFTRSGEPSLDTETLVGKVAAHMFRPLSFTASAGAAHQDDLDGGERTFIVGEGQIRWDARPTWRLVGSTARRPLVDSVTLVDRGMRLDTAGLEIVSKFHPSWTAWGDGELGRYSDGNSRETLRLAMTWRTPLARPTLSAEASVRLRRTNDDRDNGYLDMKRYDQEIVRLRLSDETEGRRLTWSAEVFYGRQAFDENDFVRTPVAEPDTPLRGGRGAIDVLLSDRFRLEAYHLRTNDALETAPGFPVRKSGLTLRVAL